MGTLVAAVVVALAALLAVLAGPLTLGVVVVLLAAVAVVDLSLLLGRAGSRPVIVVGIVPGIVLPLLVALDPADGWGLLPDVVAMSVLGGFALLLAFGRRRGVVGGLGATLLAGLFVGLGASCVLLLYALPDGFRWLLAVGVLALVADVAGPLVALARRRSPREAGLEGPEEESLVAPFDAVLPAVVAVAAAAAVLTSLLDPPLGPLPVALLAVVAVIAALGGAYLQRALQFEARISAGSGRPRLGAGRLFGLVDAWLLAAPAAYVIARSAVL